MPVNPLSVVKYLLFKYSFDGDVVTNLKMQKILYYVHTCCLISFGKACFKENFQAWPIGPVLPSVYREMKEFGALPIDPRYAGLEVDGALDKLKAELGEELTEVIDRVYEAYGTKSAFELVNLTHRENAWIKARIGLSPTESSSNEMSNSDILQQYGEK